MKKFLKIKNLFLFAAFLLAPFSASAAIIFQDNYDSLPTTNSGGAIPNGYEAWTDVVGVYGVNKGVTHYAGEISSPGREGAGKSLKNWKFSGNFNTGYAGYLNINFDWGVNKYKTLYTRMYWKWPTGLATGQLTGVGTKIMGRTYYGTSQNDPLRANTIPGLTNGYNSNSQFYFYSDDLGGPELTSSPTINSALTLAELGLDDGDWHSLEIYHKLPDEGIGNGEFGFFVDGSPVALKYRIHDGMGGDSGYEMLTTIIATNYKLTEMRLFPSGDYYFTAPYVPGQGNTGGSGAELYITTNDDWMPIEWDDYVISTTYVGLGGSSDTIPPSAPAGLSVS